MVHHKHRMVFLMFLMLITLASFSALADTKSGDYLYRLDDDEHAVITKYVGSDVILEIPDTLDDYPVVEIGTRVFYKSNLEQVDLPQSVHTIGKYAFAFCESLERVSTYATTVEENAFNSCENLAFVSLLAEETAVKTRAFYDCNNLRTLLGTIKDPQTYSFAYCEKLTQITLSGKTIDESAFTDCTGLERVSILSNTISVDTRAFYRCDHLTTVEGIVSNVQPYAFAFCDALSAITVNGKDISDSAFAYCTHLKSVNFVRSSVNVASRVFFRCTELEEVNGTVLSIGENGFGYCERLTSLHLTGPQITSNAFIGCYALRVHIPDDEDIEKVVIAIGIPYTIDGLEVPDIIIEEEPDEEVLPIDWDCENCGNHAVGHYCSICGESCPYPNEAYVKTNYTLETEGHWECPNCGNDATDNYCNWCGAAHPVVIEEVPEVLVTNVTLLNTLSYVMSPDNTIAINRVLDTGNRTYSIITADGSVYKAMIEITADSYKVECIREDFVGSYRDDPYAYDALDPSFTAALNLLLQADNRTIIEIVPLFGGRYQVTDDHGVVYVVETKYNDALKMIAIMK